MMLTAKRAAIICAHAVVGWALCGATIGIGMAITTMERTLVIHAILAPTIFALISWHYFARFHYTSPLRTALLFTGLVMALDLFVVSILMYGNLDMFQSLVGTWIPFGLILVATYTTGLLVTGAAARKAAVEGTKAR